MIVPAVELIAYFQAQNVAIKTARITLYGINEITVQALLLQFNE